MKQSKIINKVWGQEIWYSNVDEKDKNYCGKILKLKKGYRCSFHMHPKKDETFYLQSGLLRMKVEDKVYLMKPGDTLRLKPNTFHSFLGLENSVILEASTFHSDDDVVRKTESEMLEDDPWNYLFEKKHILVVGDIILDEYIYGSISRISPEAPIPVCKVTSKEHRLGGAANVALNLAKLGQDVTLIGLIGKNHHKIKQLLSKNYILDNHLILDINRPTTIKTRIITKNQHIVRLDEEETHPVDLELLKDIKLPLNPDAVIFSDYNKGFLIPTLVKNIIKKYKKKCPIIVDPKTNVEKYKGVTVFKPNKNELLNFLNTNNIDAETLMKQFNFEYLLTTTGADGYILQKKGELPVTYPIYDSSIIPVDITGAGDTFTATLATAMATGFDVDDSAKMANYTSGLTIKQIGTYAPMLTEFKNYKCITP